MKLLPQHCKMVSVGENVANNKVSIITPPPPPSPHVNAHIYICLYSHQAPSAPPQAVLLSVISPTEISVAWSEVPLVNQNGIITLYKVSYHPLEDYVDPLTLPAFLNTTELTVNLTGLYEFANYSIQVRAYTVAGPGPYSDQQFIRTLSTGI